MTNLKFRNHFKIDTPMNEKSVPVEQTLRNNSFIELAEKIKGVKHEWSNKKNFKLWKIFFYKWE